MGKVFEQAAAELKRKCADEGVGIGVIVYAYNHSAGAIAISVPNEQVRKGINPEALSDNGYVFFVKPEAVDGGLLVSEEEGEDGPVWTLAKPRIKPEELKLHHHGVNWYFWVYKHGTAEPQLVKFNPKTRRMKDSAGYLIDHGKKSEMGATLVAVARFIKDHIEGYSNLYVVAGGTLPTKVVEVDRKPVTFDDMARVGGRPPVADSVERRKAASAQAASQATATPNETPPTRPAVADPGPTVPRQTVLYETSYGPRRHSIHLPIEEAVAFAEKIYAGTLTELPEDPQMADEVRYASYVNIDRIEEILFERHPAGAILTKDLIALSSDGAIHPRHVDWLGTCNRLYGVIHELRVKLEPKGYTIESEPRTYTSGRDATGKYVHSTTMAYRLVKLTAANGVTNGVHA